MILKNKLIILIYLVCVFVFSCTENNSMYKPKSIIHGVTNHYFDLHNGFCTLKDAWGSYTIDLTLGALLEYYMLSGNEEYLNMVQRVMQVRGLEPEDTITYRAQPFYCLTFDLFMATRDTSYVTPFIHETYKMKEEAIYSPEGAVCHIGKEKNNCCLLIDYMQEYASRMAKAGWITGDSVYFNECVRQFEIYSEILEDKNSGLWSQGRGFLKDTMSLSPGAWSRGHGWLMKGMVDALIYVPEGSVYYKRLQLVLNDLVNALVKVQGTDGMWHQLLHLSFKDSYPETSGTGMIAYYMAVAINKDFIKGENYSKAVYKATHALRKYVTKEGAVLNTCKGPGPLYSIEPYYKKPAPVDEPHAAQAIIRAMTGEMLMRQK